MRNQVQITTEQRCALKMLAEASLRGCAEAVLRVYGFDRAMLAELVNAGLARQVPERVRAGGRSPDIARLRITPAGREAIR